MAVAKEASQNGATHAAKTMNQRKSEAVRQFVDNHVKDTEDITPKWQRAIDNYNRVKGNGTVR